MGYTSLFNAIYNTKMEIPSQGNRGEPVIVIMNGKIMDNVLKKMKFRVSDILELLRNQGVFDPNEVDYAILEANGSLSVLKKSEYLPLTPKDMNIEVKPTGISTELVYDGKLIIENLTQMNKDEKWLMNQLKKYGIKDVSEVFLVTLNDAGSLYVDKYDDNIKRLRILVIIKVHINSVKN